MQKKITAKVLNPFTDPDRFIVSKNRMNAAAMAMYIGIVQRRLVMIMPTIRSYRSALPDTGT